MSKIKTELSYLGVLIIIALFNWDGINSQVYHIPYNEYSQNEIIETLNLIAFIIVISQIIILVLLFFSKIISENKRTLYFILFYSNLIILILVILEYKLGANIMEPYYRQISNNFFLANSMGFFGISILFALNTVLFYNNRKFKFFVIYLTAYLLLFTITYLFLPKSWNL
ncbi:MAG TPA: hypothetical protein DIS94_12025 [Bacteroidetes bacterium]|nr:hypothetical protein [Bacteroidota bacterium]